LEKTVGSLPFLSQLHLVVLVKGDKYMFENIGGLPHRTETPPEQLPRRMLIGVKDVKVRIEAQNPAHNVGGQALPGLLRTWDQEAQKPKRRVMPQPVLRRDLAEDLFDQRPQRRRQVLVERLAAADPRPPPLARRIR
jgi:hypothetical protein